MAQKGQGASLLPSVGVQFTEDTRGKRDYKAVLRSYKKNPKQITGKAIGSFSSTRGARTPSPAALTATGDETTWSSKHDERRRESIQGPPKWRLN
jgi:hypothetical protein